MADQGSEGFLSPWLKKKRIEAVISFLKGRVLDYGCGSGSLAEFITYDRYLGIDIDEESLTQARLNFKMHCFISDFSLIEEKFDTVVSLAVIEHVSDTINFLHSLAGFLYDTKDSRLIITTPHSSMGWIHTIGSQLGLFSSHANEEHKSLLNRASLEVAGKQAGLKMVEYKRFLLGANQIAVFGRDYL